MRERGKLTIAQAQPFPVLSLQYIPPRTQELFESLTGESRLPGLNAGASECQRNSQNSGEITYGKTWKPPVPMGLGPPVIMNVLKFVAYFTSSQIVSSVSERLSTCLQKARS